MKKSRLVVSALFCVSSFGGYAQAQPSGNSAESCQKKVDHMKEQGLPIQLLNEMSEAASKNPNVRRGEKIAIVDFGKQSKMKRFFVVDVQTGQVQSHLTSHGVGSDPDGTGMAKFFGDNPDSRKSTLGLFKLGPNELTEHTVGFSLAIGLEERNKNSGNRRVGVQTCKFMNDSNAGHVGRSWGSFCLDPKVYNKYKHDLPGSMLYAGVSKATDDGNSKASPATCTFLGYSASGDGKPGENVK